MDVLIGMYGRIVLSGFLLTALLFVPAAQGQDETQELQRWQSLEQALFSGGSLSGSSGPGSVNWIDEGNLFSYMIHDQSSRTAEIRTYNPETGEDLVVFDGAEMNFPGTDLPFLFRSFQWTRDARHIVFQTNFESVYRYSGTADYYYYSVEHQTLELIADRAFTAEVSPDGSQLAYHKNGNMFVFDLTAGTERQLTDQTEPNVFYGRFGWVYEEEFGQVQAWAWSPDSRYIAFWESDEREVPLFRTTDYEGQHPEWFEIPFPKVGDTNPSVRIGVLDVQNGDKTWLDIDPGEGYIPRIYWTSREATLGVTEMNREQTEIRLHFFDVVSGQGRKVMEEKSEVWIDVFDFFAGIDDYFFFPQDREEFFWISDRSGYKHIYHFNYEGEKLAQVTDGDWQVTFVHAVDSDRELIYYTSTEASPLERHLYRIGFDGTGKTRITETPGRHRVDMGPNGRFFIDRYSGPDTPLQVELWSTDGGRLQVMEDNSAVREFIAENAYSPREFFRFTTEAGYDLDGYYILPPDFSPDERYPLILHVYGGPSAQGVYKEFETNTFNQYLAQQGYVIANVNNRGSGGYGRDFEKSVYLNLGWKEAEDVALTAKWMASEHDWIDGGRMAVRGHSYGGYLSALVMGLHPDVFQAAIIAAPVTDWRL